MIFLAITTLQNAYPYLGYVMGMRIVLVAMMKILRCVVSVSLFFTGSLISNTDVPKITGRVKLENLTAVAQIQNA